MDRREFMKLTAAGAAVMATPGCGRSTPGGRPNVLFVFDDQLRPDVCGVYRWLAGGEELYDNVADPYQMTNLVGSGAAPAVLTRLRGRLKELLALAHDDFRPGTGYGGWYDSQRNLLRTGLGPVGA
jgi:hypothetical protein